MTVHHSVRYPADIRVLVFHIAENAAAIRSNFFKKENLNESRILNKE
jgi:hypothetical protein